MTRVVITGGSGKVGRASTKELLRPGYEVINLDVSPPGEQLCRFTRVDFTDYGQVFEALSDLDGAYRGVDAVVHLAAIPGPGNAANAHLFHNNSTSSFNVFWAARKAGITAEELDRRFTRIDERTFGSTTVRIFRLTSPDA